MSKLTFDDTTTVEMTNFCETIGKNKLLVQGCGGNISQKQGETIIVKASGTNLAKANQENIFVSLDLIQLKKELFDRNLILPDNINPKPSIETFLHVLFPHKFVLHLHVVQVLAILVQKNSNKLINDLDFKDLNVLFVKYCKPGSELAIEILNTTQNFDKIDILFLENHGIVVVADNLSDLDFKLKKVLRFFSKKKCVQDNLINVSSNLLEFPIAEKYEWSPWPEINSLSTTNILLNRVRSNWAIYPDHIVFLGAAAKIVNENYLYSFSSDKVDNFPFIFVENVGTLALKERQEELDEQLRCFYDVLVRVPSNANFKMLHENEITDLLNWDAEKYRKSKVLCQ